MLFDGLLSEASSATINTLKIHKPLLEIKNSVAIVCTVITIAFSIGSNSRFSADPIETDVKAIARPVLNYLYIKYSLCFKIYPLIL